MMGRPLKAEILQPRQLRRVAAAALHLIAYVLPSIRCFRLHTVHFPAPAALLFQWAPMALSSAWMILM